VKLGGFVGVEEDCGVSEEAVKLEMFGWFEDASISRMRN